MKKVLLGLLLFIFCKANAQDIVQRVMPNPPNPHDIVASTLQPAGACGKKIVIEITSDTWNFHIRGGAPGVNVWVRATGQVQWVKIGSFNTTTLKKVFSVSYFGKYDVKLADGRIANLNVSPDPCSQLSDCTPVKTIKLIECKKTDPPGSDK